MAEAKELYKFIQLVQQMKVEKRDVFMPDKSPESVADHTASAAILAWTLLSYSDRNLDKYKVLMMVLFHDLPEAITGDYNCYDVSTGKLSADEKMQGEQVAVAQFATLLPTPSRKEFLEIFAEYEAQSSVESRFAKAIDRIETMIQWSVMDVRFYHDDFDYMGTYGNDLVREFPELYTVWAEMKSNLKKKFAEKGAVWKPEYEVKEI